MNIIRRFVKSLSYPGSIVLDFFAGSGTSGRVCVEEGRHCILIDNNESSKIFFNKHLENMKKVSPDNNFKYEQVQTINDFFSLINLMKNE